ncbi:hypothetical protein [Streptomyces mirabilis]|uniref:hypothetical protein n=1 Tax=Streptomyces mirabilis TaxID=68239 RepID=UPI00369AC6A7
MPAEAETPPGKRKTLLKTKYLFGYDAHLIVTRDAEHDVVLLDDGTPNPEVLPTLFLGVALDKPGQCPAYNGLQILNRLGERGYQPGHPAGDRAYNNSEPDEWQLPIRAMGYKPVYDYRADQRGKQAETDGAILVEGRWYCRPCPNPSSTPPSTRTPAQRARSRSTPGARSPSAPKPAPSTGSPWSTEARNGMSAALPSPGPPQLHSQNNQQQNAVMTMISTSAEQVAAAVDAQCREGFALVALDGRGGSGKSRLAAARARLGPVQGYHRSAKNSLDIAGAGGER